MIRMIGVACVFAVSLLAGCGSLLPYQADGTVPPLGKLFLSMSAQDKAFITQESDKRPSKKVFMLVSARQEHVSRHDTCEQVLLNLHGESTLTMPRKSLELHVEGNRRFFDAPKKLNEFLLISMAHDQGYFNSFLGNTLARRLSVFYSYFEYVKLYVNEEYRGLYLFLEKGHEAIADKPSAPLAVYRRNYGPTFEDKYIRKGYEHLQDSLRGRLEGVYRDIRTVPPDTLRHRILSTIDYRDYCRWLGLNRLARNGDYLDEVFFYAVSRNDSIVFRIAGWDYDDLFKGPHAGRGIPGSLVYCEEDPLDSTIARDSLLYALYRSHLRSLLEKEITNEYIGVIERRVRARLLPQFRDSATAAVMDNFSPAGFDGLSDLVGRRFRELRMRRDSILALPE